MKTSKLLMILVLTGVSFVQLSCGKSDSGSASMDKVVIQNAGSDTIVNLAQAWAEKYAELEPSVSVEVSGGGSGTGVAALINGTVDIANSSRALKDEEIERAKQNTGKEPKEFIVGYDALAVYVHHNNPLDQISIQQLADIYGENGQTIKWSQLGIKNTECSSDEIIRISRQSNSGTYDYFREALLGESQDFKLGSRDLHGSKDVVELIEKTPCAIGYSGMGYATERVKMLKVAKADGVPAYEPNLENALNDNYPISRPLFMYTLGEPTGKIKTYMDWIHSAEGQAMVKESGYVPLPEKK